MPDWQAVKSAILAVMRPAQPTASDLSFDKDPMGNPYYGAAFVHLAYQCAATFRRTDYQGGCNGARIRFSPQKDWPVNTKLDQVLNILQPVYTQFSPKLTWADLIVYAGTVALEDASGIDFPFCPGRSDVASQNDPQPKYLSPTLDFAASDFVNNEVRQRLTLMGMSVREYVLLKARLRSPSLMAANGYTAKTWTTDITKLSNQFHQNLVGKVWTPITAASGKTEYKPTDATGSDLRMIPSDINLINAGQEDFALLAQQYSYDEARFQKEFVMAWTKLMNIDRFDGPTGNKCYGSSMPTPAPADSNGSARPFPVWAVAVISGTGAIVIATAVFCFIQRKKQAKGTPLLDDSA
jgi:catalase (peroxidase I)